MNNNKIYDIFLKKSIERMSKKAIGDNNLRTNGATI
jgi:hypothetical protein